MLPRTAGKGRSPQTGRPAVARLNRVGIKLGLAMGLLLCLFVIAALVSVFHARVLDERVRQITDVEEPTRAAAYEMEIDVIGLGKGVLGYLDNSSPAHRLQVARDDRAFRSFKGEYDRLAQTSREKELGAQVEILYLKYLALGSALMDRHDQEEVLVATVIQRQEDVQLAVENAAEQTERAETRYIADKAQLWSLMAADMAQMGAWLSSYLRSPRPEYQERVVQEVGQVRRGLAWFKRLPLTNEEAALVPELEARFEETWGLAQTVMELRQDMDRDLASFLALREDLDRVLNQEVQVLTGQDLAEATRVAYLATSRTQMVVLVLLLAGLGAGALAVAGITHSITEPVGKLAAAIRLVGAGDLSQRVALRSRDELGFLGEAFNEMTAQRQQAQEALRHAHDELELRVQERTVELAHAKETMTVINEVAQIITSTLDINQVYEPFAREAMKLVDFDRISINVINRNEGSFTFKYVAGLTAPGRNPGDSMPLAGSQAEKVMLTKRSQVRNDVEAGQSVIDSPVMLQSGIRSSIVAPLVAKGEVIGGLSLWSRRPDAYGPQEQTILEQLAGQIAPTVENARLYEEVLKEKERATTALSRLQEEVVERQRREDALLASEERYRALTYSASDAIVSADSNGVIISWNRGAQAIFGYTEAQALGQPLSLLMPERFGQVHNLGIEAANTIDQSEVTNRTLEVGGLRKDGSQVPLELSLASWNAGNETFYVGIMRDITERKRLEAQFIQAQKMESVGRLAGGVAHDFNNLLTAILGYSQISISELPASHPVLAHLQELDKAAQRAASLTRQLLTFSRHQAIEASVVDLNVLLMEMYRMLRRLIGENIELVILPALDLAPVKVDPGQVDQLVMNLAVNARDAMPNGGKITVETANVTLDALSAAAIPEAAPGQYVMLAVSDTGTGMTEEVKAHLFEPFFTTKETGRGTGLGLATCYGIVRRSGGYIAVESEPGRGTTFKIYLPAMAAEGAAGAGKGHVEELPRGTETVLLAEDEPALRAMEVRLLGELGYNVLVAGDGEEALRLAQERQGEEIHLLLTDMVMPRMGGVELAGQFKKERPQARVLFASGYLEDPLLLPSADQREANFIHKPFLLAVLAHKMREVLDQ